MNEKNKHNFIIDVNDTFNNDEAIITHAIKYKCNDCGIIGVSYNRKNIHVYYVKDYNFTCNELIVKNIIE